MAMCAYRAYQRTRRYTSPPCGVLTARQPGDRHRTPPGGCWWLAIMLSISPFLFLFVFLLPLSLSLPLSCLCCSVASALKEVGDFQSLWLWLRIFVICIARLAAAAAVTPTLVVAVV